MRIRERKGEDRVIEFKHDRAEPGSRERGTRALAAHNTLKGKEISEPSKHQHGSTSVNKRFVSGKALVIGHQSRGGKCQISQLWGASKSGTHLWVGTSAGNSDEVENSDVWSRYQMLQFPTTSEFPTELPTQTSTLVLTTKTAPVLASTPSEPGLS